MRKTQGLKTKLLGMAVVAATTLAIGLTAHAQGQQQVLVIQGGTLIDGNGGAPVPNSVIVIQGNRVTAVGRAGAVQVPAGATVTSVRLRLYTKSSSTAGVNIHTGVTDTTWNGCCPLSW